MSPAARSGEKRLFSQAKHLMTKGQRAGSLDPFPPPTPPVILPVVSLLPLMMSFFLHLHLHLHVLGRQKPLGYHIFFHVLK